MYRVFTKKARDELKKGPRHPGMPRPIPFAIKMKQKKIIDEKRYRRKWARKMKNWWRDLMPEDMQPELRRLGKGQDMSHDAMTERLKSKMSSISGLHQLSNHWYAELSTQAGYSIDLMYYVYRRRPSDFTGFCKYFLLRSVNVNCVEDVAELGELYQFMEKNFYHEMRSHHYAVRVHTAWLHVIGRYSLMVPRKLYGGDMSTYSQLGLNVDGTLANGLRDDTSTEDLHSMAKIYNLIQESQKHLSEEEILHQQQIAGDSAVTQSSSEEQEQLEAFLLLANYVSAFEQKLQSIPNVDQRTTVPYFSTYLMVKKAYEQFRPMYQWHPISAARSVDFVKTTLQTAGDPARIFTHYFSDAESLKRHDGQLLTPSSYTYEGLQRALIGSGKLYTFVKYSRQYQDPEIHSLALRRMYTTKDWVLAQRFIVMNYKCNIDELTRKENSLEPSIEDLGFMISIFSKNEKKRVGLVLCNQLMKRLQTHPKEVIDCRAPFAEIKDYTKYRDPKLFEAVLRVERAIREKQKELGVTPGFAKSVQVKTEVQSALHEAMNSAKEILPETEGENEEEEVASPTKKKSQWLYVNQKRASKKKQKAEPDFASLFLVKPE